MYFNLLQPGMYNFVKNIVTEIKFKKKVDLIFQGVTYFKFCPYNYFLIL